jgi:hypothetical protein
MSLSIVSNIVRLLIFLLLVNIICGLSATSDDNRRFYQLLKQRSAENDYEYVWFTRDIHNDMDSEDIKREQLRKQQDLLRLKIFKNIFDRKYPFIENNMYKTK